MEPTLVGTLLVCAACITAALQPEPPEEFLIRVLGDKYVRSPAVLLVENYKTTLERVEAVWSRVVHPPALHLLIAAYNSTGLWKAPRRAASVGEAQESIQCLRASERLAPGPGGRVFGAVAQVSAFLPFDSAVLLLTTRAPDTLEDATRATQALIQKRCKLFVVWLEQEGVPAKYVEAARRTGGETLDAGWTEPAEDDADPDRGQTTPPNDAAAELRPQEVLVAVRSGVRGRLRMPIDVDADITSLYVTTSGRIEEAFLYLPSGEVVDLSNSTTTSTSEEEEGRLPTEGEEGVWWLETSGALYDVKVAAASRLAYDAVLDDHLHVVADRALLAANRTRRPAYTSISSGNLVRLRRLRGEGRLESVVLVDETGKELTALKQLSGDEHGGPDGVEGNDTEWHIPESRLPFKRYYVRLSGRTGEGARFQRLSTVSLYEGGPVTPVTVELSERSQLRAQPGQTVQLFFDVTNYHYAPLEMMFYVEDDRGFIRNINPKRQIVYPQTKIQVNVILEVRATGQDVDTVRMTAESIAPVTGKAYLYVGQQGQWPGQGQGDDAARPDISVTTEGYCRDYLSPTVCYSRYWSVDATIRDGNGVLRVRSVPLGLQYRTDFVAGTREAVRVHYTSTCCNTKVDLIAIDIDGNMSTRTVDIEKVWLTAGEITAIVLGSILILLVLLLIIVGIVLCIRRRRNRNFIMHR